MKNDYIRTRANARLLFFLEMSAEKSERDQFLCFWENLLYGS